MLKLCKIMLNLLHFLYVFYPMKKMTGKILPLQSNGIQTSRQEELRKNYKSVL
jgi:hypothetical protein